MLDVELAAGSTPAEPPGVRRCSGRMALGFGGHSNQNGRRGNRKPGFPQMGFAKRAALGPSEATITQRRFQQSPKPQLSA